MRIKMLAEAIGAIFKERRAALGWTQGQAATSIGVERQIYARVESGRHTPGLATFLLFCEGLQLHPADALRLALQRRGALVVSAEKGGSDE